MPRRWPESVALWCGVLVVAACGGDGRELADPTAPAPAPTTTTTTITTTFGIPDLSILTPLSVPELGPGMVGDHEVVIERLSSPENAIAVAVGTGAHLADPVTVDDAPADIVSFDTHPDGSFEVRVFITDEGAHTVCVAATCGRVYTLAPDAESREEVIAKIDQAIPLATGIVPADVWFPDWTIEVGGQLSGTGGSTDVEQHRVVIYRNRGRSVEEFVRTIVHEYGHVADAEWLTDELRAEFAELRGFGADVPWMGGGGHRMSDWEGTPGEDFAEVMAALWSGGQWDIRTDGGPLTDEARTWAEALVVANT